MSLRGCEHQQAVQEASASGRWSAALEAHAASCSTCSDVRLISEAFASWPAEPSVKPRVDPALLWARAREDRRMRTEVRMSLVTTITEMVVGAGVIVAILAAAVLFLPRVSWQLDWSQLEGLALGVDPRIWLYATLTAAALMAGLVLAARVAAHEPGD